MNGQMPLPSALKNKITPANPEPVIEVVKPIVAGGRCYVCKHDQRSEIEAMFADQVSARKIADWLIRQGHVEIKEKTIFKHFNECVPGALLRGSRDKRSADTFLTRIEGLTDRLEGYLDEFDSQDPDKSGPKDWRGLAAIVNQLRSTLELLGKTLGHVRPDVEINIVESPQFQTVVMPIVQVTAKCSHCGPIVESMLTEENA